MGHWVSDFGQVGSGQVTAECVRPMFDLVLRFNMRVYLGTVFTDAIA